MASKCEFRPGTLPGFPEIVQVGWLLTPTWVAVNDKAPKLPWTLYHVLTGAWTAFVRTKREAEYLALALGESGPWDGRQVRDAIEWAKAHYELENAQRALERAKKKAQGPVIEKLTEAT